MEEEVTELTRKTSKERAPDLRMQQVLALPQSCMGVRLEMIEMQQICT